MVITQLSLAATLTVLQSFQFNQREKGAYVLECCCLDKSKIC